MARPISQIAADIRKAWPNIYFGAVPYLEAMDQFRSVSDLYYEDDARWIVLYFLGNAGCFRGEEARKLKAELKALVK